MSLHVFRGSSFGSFLWWFCCLCTDGVEPFCLPCEESVRALLSSDLDFVLCLTFDHLWSLFCFGVDFFFIFHMVTVCVVNALIKGEIEDQEHPRARVVAP